VHIAYDMLYDIICDIVYDVICVILCDVAVKKKIMAAGGCAGKTVRTRKEKENVYNFIQIQNNPICASSKASCAGLKPETNRFQMTT
jgi:hypothetical protein